MKGQLAKNIKTMIFIAPDQIFVTFGLVILLNLKVKILLICANCIFRPGDPWVEYAQKTQ